VDAHARIKLGDNRFIAFPSYQQMFSLLNTFIVLNKPLSKDAMLASGQIIGALARGRSFFAFQSLGDANGFEFYAERHDNIILPQDTLVLDNGLESSLRVVVPANENFVAEVYRNGQAMDTSRVPETRLIVSSPGVYRVVVFQERLQFPWLSRRRVPWIFSSPIVAVKE
jgi:hypothetical protein